MSIPFTWVYLIKDNETGYHKIGRSDDPYTRLSQLMREQTLGPKPKDFVLIEAWLVEAEFEQELHAIYADIRIRGEWFDLTPEHVSNISEMLACCRRLTQDQTAEQDERDYWDKHQAERIHALEEDNKRLRARIEELEAETRGLTTF